MMTVFVDDDNDDETARWCVVGPLRWALDGSWWGV
jgi:hypothetical protein